MKVNFKTSSITSFSDSKEFKFSNSPQLFRILSDNLYSNKLGSIIREIGTNCLDAHVLNGNENIPFEITIPNNNVFDKSQQNLEFRDFGPGLSKEEIYTIYTTYCLSTKDTSDDFVGAFGIGSKSPFAYTNSFSVTSIHSGVKTLYSMYINDKGFPAISEVFSEETDEHSGLTVSIPIKNEDIRNVKAEIDKQLGAFKVLPNIKNSDGTVINDIFTERHVNEECFIDNENAYLGRKPYSSRYVINVSGIEYDIPEEVFEKFGISKIIGHIVVLKAKIGSIDLVASREKIALTPKTLNFIENGLKEVYLELLKPLLNLNNWDRWSAIKKYFNNVSTINLKDLLYFLNSFNKEEIEDFLCSMFQLCKFKYFDRIQIIYQNNGSVRAAKYNQDCNKRPFYLLQPQEGVEIYAFSKIRKKGVCNKPLSLYVFPMKKLNTQTEIKEYFEIVKEFSNFLQHPIINGDEEFREQIVSEKTSSRRITHPLRWLWITSSNRIDHSYISRSCINYDEYAGDDEGFLEELNKDNVFIAGYDTKTCRATGISGNELNPSIFSCMESKKLKGKKLVLLTNKEYEKLKDKIKAPTIDYFLKKELQEIINEDPESYKLFTSNDVRIDVNYGGFLKNFSTEELENLAKNNEHIKNLVILSKYAKFKIKYSSLLFRLINFFNIPKTESTLLKEIQQHYPLLKYISDGITWPDEQCKQHIKIVVGEYLTHGGCDEQ